MEAYQYTQDSYLNHPTYQVHFLVSPVLFNLSRTLVSRLDLLSSTSTFSVACGVDWALGFKELPPSGGVGPDILCPRVQELMKLSSSSFPVNGFNFLIFGNFQLLILLISNFPSAPVTSSLLVCRLCDVSALTF